MRQAAVGLERDRNFRNPLAGEAGLDDHLAGELHSRTAQAQPPIEIERKTAHPTVDVANRCAEPPAREQRKHRIAHPAMEWGHGARQDASTAARQAASLHQRMTAAELSDELRNLLEVVAV